MGRWWEGASLASSGSGNASESWSGGRRSVTVGWHAAVGRSGERASELKAGVPPHFLFLCITLMFLLLLYLFFSTFVFLYFSRFLCLLFSY